MEGGGQMMEMLASVLIACAFAGWCSATESTSGLPVRVCLTKSPATRTQRPSHTRHYYERISWHVNCLIRGPDPLSQWGSGFQFLSSPLCMLAGESMMSRVSHVYACLLYHARMHTSEVHACIHNRTHRT